MKKFVFSLEKVLDFKQQTLDVKKSEIAILQMKVHEIESQIENLNEKYKASNAKMVEELKQGITQNDMANYKMYFTTLNDKIQLLLQSREKLLQLIEEKKKELVQINSEISGLEKLKDKQLEEYLKAKQKSEDLAIEEFVSQARGSAG